jgi:hypothetical protein
LGRVVVPFVEGVSSAREASLRRSRLDICFTTVYEFTEMDSWPRGIERARHILYHILS